MQLLTPDEVAEKLNIQRRFLMEKLKDKPEFPKAVVLSPHTYRWIESDINAYIENMQEAGQ